MKGTYSMENNQSLLFTTDYELVNLYQSAHNIMRNVDGLQPQEAFDELLKILFFKQANEELGPEINIPSNLESLTDADVQEFSTIVETNFLRYVKTFNSWFQELWKDANIYLSPKALVQIFNLFSGIVFSQVSFDIRSAAIKEFLTPDIRKGLGIYLTPDEVVRMMVGFVAPTNEQSIYDPTCGSGTFLIEAIKFIQVGDKKNRKHTIWGTDKNPRMLLLAELNLGHYPSVSFHRRVIDALFPASNTQNEWPKKNSFDVIFTNPPFGVLLNNTTFDLRNFKTCRTSKNSLVTKQQSEVVFIEKNLEYLKPGGTLAIVLPKSITTNSSLNEARKVLGNLGYIYATVLLPPETFAATGTQTSTIVLFIKKYKKDEDTNEPISIVSSEVKNVGYDATGRVREGSELPNLAKNLRNALTQNKGNRLCRMLPSVPKRESFSSLRKLLSSTMASHETVRLGDVVEIITNGRTPNRKNYAESGLFVVKVGNLTGKGINWEPRKRNFVDSTEASKRKSKTNLMLQKGDILLTAAAHSPVYIAQKVDIVQEIPNWLNSVASIVGEVMLIRVKKELINPYALLAYFRIPNTKRNIQKLIRGQTAHLYAKDVLNLQIPKSLLKPDKTLQKLMHILEQEADLNDQLNRFSFEQQKTMELVKF